MTVKAIVTDIEGTTSSIAFVKDVLFPYAHREMEAFLERHWREPAVAAAVGAAADQAGQALDTPAEAARVLRRWIDEDRKITPLKTLQGLIWRAGYERGDYRAHLYPDTAGRLRHWHDAGLALYVYSSGSVAAQKLFFGYSEAGDLTPLFSGFFDTTTGGKKEADSYRAIQAAIGEPADAILFLSDVEAELDAARAAGLRTILLDRLGTVTDSAHPVVPSFEQIDPLSP
ncbi:acireductone synthase [Alloalcanivorax gelatiniphagus]|uniref:Enolase-phosphatase E1 n=1 Tax=Alloalcanivorax gelatiniphagus TaxID=1194167 RepID=A0ABY2XQ27_9GAMM|nr:acireductone synthase [Alloalcanivorax gelatiniphagus]TMW13825.1 acireductone synthase [Alloalcanivorax gelatiniphagus]